MLNKAEDTYSVGQKNEKTLTLLRDDFLKTFELSAEMNKTRLIAFKLIFKIVFTFLPFYQPNFQAESISFHVMQHEKHRLSTRSSLQQ